MTNKLIGKTILDLKIASDKQALLFISENEEIKVFVDADCCSYTWIESIELPALGFPFKILDIQDLDLEKDAEYDDDEFYCLQFYGARIVTDKGDMVIDYRNESNGYYGGDIVWPTEEGNEFFYGGVHGQNISSLEWEDIIDAG